MAEEAWAGILLEPHAPTSVGVTPIDANTASVTWAARPTNQRPIKTFAVERWDNATNTWVAASGNLGDSRRQVNVSISGNRRFQFRVQARGDGGWSAHGYSNYIQTAPASPAGATAVRSGADAVAISWANGATTSNYSYLTSLEEQVNGGGWTEIAHVGGGVASYVRAGRTPGAVYAYRVRHMATDIGPGGWSDYSTSGTVQILTLPAAPVVVSTVRANDNSFTLNWTNKPNTTVAPYDSLTVQRWDNVSNAWTTIGTLGPTATSLTDTSTVADRAYMWRVAASNIVGSSEWATFTTYQTKPAAPVEIKTQAAPGGALKVTWINKASYAAYSTVVRYFKNGVLVKDNISVAAGETSYTLTGVDLTATYTFGVKTVSTVGYVSESAWVDGIATAAATVPNAPVDLAPNGKAADVKVGAVLTWTHNPSLDASAQVAFEVQYSTNGGTTWATSGKIASASPTWTLPKTLSNGVDITWQVRTYGVHATPSAYSARALFRASTTPTVTINQPTGPRLTISKVVVDWSFGDAEGMPQAAWEVELLNAAGALLESQTGSGQTRTVTLKYVVLNGESYTLRVRVQDGDGLQSNWAQKNLVANFIPPAMPSLSADYSNESGVVVLTLTPTADDGGKTNLPSIGVDIERRLLDQATGTFGAWESLAVGVSPSTTLIDTTAPIAGDGEYRAVAHSAAPSSQVSAAQPPSGQEDRWVYVSGGANFRQVTRLMGNVALRTTTTRDRSLHQFAGRKKPVMFVGEAVTRTIDVSGLLDGESSSPAEWEELIASSDVLLFRDPLGHRIYGSIPQVAIDHLGNEMFAISFTVTEVSYP